MSLRFKIGILVIGFLSILISIHGVYSIYKQWVIYRSELIARGHSILASLAIPCGVAIANSEIELLDTYLDLFKDESLYNLDITHIIVFDQNGVILSHTDQNEFGKKCTNEFCMNALRNDDLTTRTVKVGSGEILEVAYPISSGLKWGTLVVGFSLDRINKIIFKSIIFNILFVISFFVVGVVVLYFLLSKIVIRPIRALSNESAAFMKNVTGSSTIPLMRSKNEIENLRNVFFAMKSRIEAHTQRLENLVAERTAKLEDAMRKLEELAITDGLTGLYNHRYFKTALDMEIRRFKRLGYKISLLMIDVDDFKLYNDRYGHVNGDACLVKISEKLKKSLRGTDIIARYGGEEFAVILFNTKKDDAISIAKKLKSEVESIEHVPEGANERVKVTISVGVASFPYDADNPIDLIARADEAMYRAKSSGKNSVVGY